MAYQDINMVISTGQSYVPGQFIQVIHDLSNYMFGQVVYYSPYTGDLTFTPTAVAGSGGYTDWKVVPSGSNGAATLYQGTTTNTIPVPSTTTTTTLPPTPTYFYYNVSPYTCPGCVEQLSLVARSSVSRIYGFFYNIGDGLVYKVQDEIAYTGYTIDLDGSAAGSNCSSACSI